MRLWSGRWRGGALVVGLLALGGPSCTPSPGPFELDPVQGQVVDQDTGEPIAGATVFEWYRGGGVPGASRPELHSRWTTSDAGGRFAFPRVVAPSPRMWTTKVYGPTLSFYHPRYGLVHAGSPPGGGAEAVLRGTTRTSEARLADLQPYCRGEIEGAGARRLAAIACPARPRR